MTEHYRGHRIQLTRSGGWDAVIVEASSGVVLPTKATAQLDEGRSIAMVRAYELIDIYVDAAPLGRCRAA